MRQKHHDVSLATLEVLIHLAHPVRKDLARIPPPWSTISKGTALSQWHHRLGYRFQRMPRQLLVAGIHGNITER
jgi:hypothetical protein